METWIHTVVTLTDGPCAGQTLRPLAKYRAGLTLDSQLPYHSIWVCRPPPTASARLPGPWYEYYWDRKLARYGYAGRQIRGY